jgi:hypothetical protein
MDARLTRNNKAGREARGSKDTVREAPENKFESNRRRNKMFRDEFTQEALPTAPEIPGFHTCWLSTTHQYDPIHKRMRIGYTPVKADEVPGFENFRVKAGEMEGFVACNEMVLYKLPIDIYQDYMAEVHHWSPMDEQDKIKVQQEQLLNARDSNGKKLGGYEGNGYEDGFDQDLSKDAPIFS